MLCSSAPAGRVTRVLGCMCAWNVCTSVVSRGRPSCTRLATTNGWFTCVARWRVGRHFIGENVERPSYAERHDLWRLGAGGRPQYGRHGGLHGGRAARNFLRRPNSFVAANRTVFEPGAVRFERYVLRTVHCVPNGLLQKILVDASPVRGGLHVAAVFPPHCLIACGMGMAS